ncbi:MAG TPA: RcpC/CpaB family pilus assembly protein [Acidimicrobiales bacterium]|nr:RcpC/CpaB family pilus assembly protein [Acidimicrobiales bacterium]
MGKNRSTILIGIGVAVFVVGASLAFLAVRHGGEDNSPRVQTAATLPVSKPGQVTGSDATGAPVAVFEIPTGKQAVAVQVGYVQGVAGFVKSGDKVNVFGTVKPGSPAPKGLPAAPAVKLLLSGVEVLSASAPAVGGPSTYVLALNAADAEQVVYLQTFEGLYFSLARSDQGILTTPGRSSGSPF